MIQTENADLIDIHVSDPLINSSTLICNLNNVNNINMDNTFFFDINYDNLNETNLNTLKSKNVNTIVDFSYYKYLKKFCNNSYISILHLNINSIFSKINEIDSILSLNYDIVMFNETKLDNVVPNSFYKNVNYNILRLDRNRHGGGILVFIRKEYTYINNRVIDNLEALCFQITVKKSLCTFIATYKPPSKNEIEYLDELENLLCTIDPNQPIFIIGDLNMDLKTKKGKNLINFMKNNDFSNFVKSYTRIDSKFFQNKNKFITSKSLIDVILHNGNSLINTDTLDCPFSDHRFVIANLKFQQAKRTKPFFYGRNLCQKNLIEIITNINLLDFNYITEDLPIDIKWTTLKSDISEIVDSIAPKKQIISSYKAKFPWSDGHLQSLKRLRDNSYKNFRLNPTFDSQNYYKNCRTLYQSEMRIKMIKYFKSKSNINDFRNSKNYWEFYSSSIKLKSDKALEPISLKIENKMITDAYSISNSFNNFFTSLKSTSTIDLETCISKIDHDFRELKLNGLINSGVFTFRPTNETIVRSLLKNMKDDCSLGITGIPSKILKNSEEIVTPLTHLINECIEKRSIPDEWKSAVVTPLYKSKEDKCDLNNYRGISILSPFAKIFEKILATQVIDYLNEFSILCLDQHGFRDSHSCESALHELITDLNNSRDNELCSLLLFIDFRKAFDLVDSNLLIRKLQHLGFDMNSLDLIRNYFWNRTQLVNYNNVLSESKETNLGTPQGSILGPLFFSLFINELPYLLNNVKKKLFADDTTIYNSMKNVDELIQSFSMSLLPLIDWCKFNRMDINWTKTFFMFIKNKRFDYPKKILINHNEVEVVDSFKLLGVHIDSKLNFLNFISNTKKLVNTKLYSINRLFYLSYNVKIQFSKTFILPYFTYCITLSIYFPKSTLQSLSNFYYYCLYKLFKLKHCENLTELNNSLESKGLCSFQHLLLNRLLIFSHKILNKKNAPIQLNNLLINQKNTNHNLRSNNILFKSTIPRNHYGESTFNYFFPNLVNTLCKNDIFLDINFFNIRIKNNINLLVIKFIEKFSKFDINIKNFDFIKNN